MAFLVNFSCNRDDGLEYSMDQAAHDSDMLSTPENWIAALKMADENAVFSSVLDLRETATSSDCYEEPPTGSQCASNYITTTMYLAANPLDGRPACGWMDVSFNLTICLLPDGTYAFTFSHLEAFPSANCPAFIAWYNALSSQQKADAQDKWEFDMSLSVELNYVTGISAYIPESCNSTSTFIVDNCYNRCLVSCNECPGGFKVIKTFCGTQCCKRKRKVCKTASGTVYFLEPVYSTVGDACTSLPPSCPPGGIPLNAQCGVVCGPK